MADAPYATGRRNKSSTERLPGSSEEAAPPGLQSRPTVRASGSAPPARFLPAYRRPRSRRGPPKNLHDARVARPTPSSARGITLLHLFIHVLCHSRHHSPSHPTTS